jgi:cell division protein FtsW (lipid II flippase)
MKKSTPPQCVVMCLALLILGVAGCGSAPDERLAQFAQQSMAEQRQQNNRLADQSQAVVAESHQLAEAAKQLVTRDAQARRELIAAQTQMTSQLNQQQSAIYTGRERLEQDRREIAEQRHRDPIIAALIQNFGLAIACLLPLLVAVLVIRQMQSQEPDHAAVAELLTLELTSDEPRLFLGSQQRHHRLTHDSLLNDEEQAHHSLTAGDSTAGDSFDDIQPLF